MIDDRTDMYGIKVIHIGTQQIELPRSMKVAMGMVTQTLLEKEAKVIDAQGNFESAKMFREAADELAGNAITLQLKYFDSMKNISKENSEFYLVPDKILSAIGYSA